MKIKISVRRSSCCWASAISGTTDKTPPKAFVESEQALLFQGDLKVSVPVQNIGTVANQKISFGESIKTWGPSEIARFRKLAEKRAIGTIEATEQVEFEVLQLARRRLESPRSAEDIFADWRAHQLMRDLKSLFEKHVSFFGTKS